MIIDKNNTDDIPKEILPAIRMMLLDTIQSNVLSSDVTHELKEMILCIESKLKDNNISLNTSVSQADMERAQKYMGGFSGISNSNISYNNYKKGLEGSDIAVGFVVIMILLSMIGSFFSWLGGVISNLWTSGIIPGILGALGLGGVGVGIYKLYENGFFDKIKNYFEEKKIEKNKKKKYKQSISKVKEREKINSKESEEEKENLLGIIIYFVKNVFISYTTCAILATVGYHIVDKNEFNGQKISLEKVGRLEDEQYRPQQEFNANWEVLKNSRSSKDIMYDVPEERKRDEPDHYILDTKVLEDIADDNIYGVRRCMKGGSFSGVPKYYHLDKTLFPFVNDYDKELIEMFMDYRNAMVYYASNDMSQELYNAINNFYIDCYLLFLEEKTYQLSNHFFMCSYKFDEASSLAKVVSLEICNSLLSIEDDYVEEVFCYSEKLSRSYLINLQELRDFVESELEIAKRQDKNKQYVKYYWMHND